MAITSFTQAQLAAGEVRYVHDGGETISDGFTFSVKDDDGTGPTGQTFSITVNPVNDVPQLPTNTGLTLDEGATQTITTAMLNATDADDTDANVTFTVTAGVASGRLELSTNPGVAITSFTQAQLAAGEVRYVHDGTATASDSFAFSVQDDEGAGPTGQTFNITVNLGPAHAALNDLGNGLIYDISLNVTWLKDANLVKTSCDANDALWQAFDPAAVANNSGRSKAAICADNGVLNWYEAEAWIALLNARGYLGYRDWRQPMTSQPDTTCSDTDGLGENIGYRCEGSELGHLYNVALNNPNLLDDGCGINCLQNAGPFSNVQASHYWSGTDYNPDTDYAWVFDTSTGSQGTGARALAQNYVWPVRSGRSDVVSIPLFGAWGLGLVALLLAGVARHRLR